MSPETIKELRSCRAWGTFEEYVRKSIDKLNTLDGIMFTDQYAAAVEGEGRQLAVEKLREILESTIVFDTINTNDKEETELNAGII